MFTYYIVLQLLSTLKRLFPVRWASIYRDIPRAMTRDIDVRLYMGKGGRRDIEAENMLASYATMFGLKVFRLDGYADEKAGPLRVSGPATVPVDKKIRRVLDAGITVRFGLGLNGLQRVNTAMLRRIDARCARLDAWDVESVDYLANDQRIQGNFRGARPLESLIHLLPVIDVTRSLFDDAQMGAVIEALGTRDECFLYASGIVRNPLCFWSWVEKLERYAESESGLAGVLCFATNIIPEAYERFVARVAAEDVEDLLEASGVHPAVRRLLEVRHSKMV